MVLVAAQIRDGREVYVSEDNGSTFDLPAELVEELKDWFAKASAAIKERDGFEHGQMASTLFLDGSGRAHVFTGTFALTALKVESWQMEEMVK